MNVLLIDNYDSFTYNLVQLLEEEGADVTIMKNDAVDLAEAALFRKILLSPGPRLPQEAEGMMALIDGLHQTASILGVCLGHQALVCYFGGRLKQSEKIRHGHQNTARISGQHQLFRNLPDKMLIGHYHSWIAAEPIPEELIVTMRDENNHVMAIKHSRYNLHGVQFHPESVMTPDGRQMISNWLWD